MGRPSPIVTIQALVSGESGPSFGLKYLGMFHVKPGGAAAGPDRDDLRRNRDWEIGGIEPADSRAIPLEMNGKALSGRARYL